MTKSFESNHHAYLSERIDDEVKKCGMIVTDVPRIATSTELSKIADCIIRLVKDCTTLDEGLLSLYRGTGNTGEIIDNTPLAITALLRKRGIAFPEYVFIATITGQMVTFERTRLLLLDRFLDEVWCPIQEDIILVSESLDWCLFLCHEGYVGIVKQT